MSETQVLLGKISALRQRLEQVRAVAQEAGTAAAGLLAEADAPGLARLWALQQQTAAVTEAALNLDKVVRPVVGRDAPASLPSQLTARARRVLERGRELLAGLRALADEPAVQEAGSPLTGLYRQTTALTDAGLRLVQGLPDSAGGQLQVSEGIEVVLDDVARRLATLQHLIGRHRDESARIDLLADLFSRLDGPSADLSALTALAETIRCEAEDGVPLRFLTVPQAEVRLDRRVAAHALTVAQVMARQVRHEPELKGRAIEAVLAALLHDVGMLQVPAEVLLGPDPIDEVGRRALEAHCHAGAEVLARALPDAAWLQEAARAHHERLDGTGYPDGLREYQTSPLARLLAVCDVYAAQCQPRPHRPARDTRSALTEALLMAEQGWLDRHFAERLLSLSFYPPGSAVEMADGAVAVVVATPARPEQSVPSRPVIALLTDSQRRWLPAPRYIDLAQTDAHSIVRGLSAPERLAVLALRYPEWAI